VIEEFRVRDDRDLTPLVEKLIEHGASTVFTIVVGVKVACVRMPPSPEAAAICRELVADWNENPWS
jgi:hypothetical protein